MPVEPDDGRVTMDSNILPLIVAGGASNKPVRAFPVGDFSSCITEYLKDEPDARSVAVTASLFGLPGLSTQLIILYIDGEGANKESLAKSAAVSDIPANNIEVKFGDIVDDIDEAHEMIEPSGIDKMAPSECKASLGRYFPIRAPQEVSRDFHGQPIFPIYEGTEGSVGVSLSPTDCSDSEEVYAVTAAHVLPKPGPQSTEDVIMPGKRIFCRL